MKQKTPLQQAIDLIKQRTTLLELTATQKLLIEDIICEMMPIEKDQIQDAYYAGYSDRECHKQYDKHYFTSKFEQ